MATAISATLSLFRGRRFCGFLGDVSQLRGLLLLQLLVLLPTPHAAAGSEPDCKFDETCDRAKGKMELSCMCKSAVEYTEMVFQHDSDETRFDNKIIFDTKRRQVDVPNMVASEEKRLDSSGQRIEGYTIKLTNVTSYEFKAHYLCTVKSSPGGNTQVTTFTDNTTDHSCSPPTTTTTTTTTSTSTPKNTSSTPINDDLSSEANGVINKSTIIIVVGAAVFFVVIIVISCFVVRARRQRREKDRTTSLDLVERGFGPGRNLIKRKTDNKRRRTDVDVSEPDSSSDDSDHNRHTEYVTGDNRNQARLGEVEQNQRRGGREGGGGREEGAGRDLGTERGRQAPQRSEQAEETRGRPKRRQRPRARGERDEERERRSSWPRNMTSRRSPTRHASREHLWERDQGEGGYHRPRRDSFASSRMYKSEESLESSDAERRGRTGHRRHGTPSRHPDDPFGPGYGHTGPTSGQRPYPPFQGRIGSPDRGLPDLYGHHTHSPVSPGHPRHFFRSQPDVGRERYDARQLTIPPQENGHNFANTHILTDQYNNNNQQGSTTNYQYNLSSPQGPNDYPGQFRDEARFSPDRVQAGIHGRMRDGQLPTATHPGNVPNDNTAYVHAQMNGNQRSSPAPPPQQDPRNYFPREQPHWPQQDPCSRYSREQPPLSPRNDYQHQPPFPDTPRNGHQHQSYPCLARGNTGGQGYPPNQYPEQFIHYGTEPHRYPIRPSNRHHPQEPPPMQNGRDASPIASRSPDAVNDNRSNVPYSAVPPGNQGFSGGTVEQGSSDFSSSPAFPDQHLSPSPSGPGLHPVHPEVNRLSRDSVSPSRAPTTLNVPVPTPGGKGRTSSNINTTANGNIRVGEYATGGGSGTSAVVTGEPSRGTGRSKRRRPPPGEDFSSDDRPSSSGENSPRLRFQRCRRGNRSLESSDSDNATIHAARGRQIQAPPGGAETEVDIRDIKTEYETRCKRPVSRACSRKDSVRRLPVVCAADVATSAYSPGYPGNVASSSRGVKTSFVPEGERRVEPEMGREVVIVGVENGEERVEMRRGTGTEANRGVVPDGRVERAGSCVGQGHTERSSARLEQMGVEITQSSPEPSMRGPNSANPRCSDYTEHGHNTTPKALRDPHQQ